MFSDIKVGQFIRARVEFRENDGRSKIRPCLVLGTAKHGGHTVYLCSPGSTKTGKVQGAVEVILNHEEAVKVGYLEETVFRFSRCSLVAILDRDVSSVYGSCHDTSPAIHRAILNAAHSIGCPL